jgi:hypothetical protein
LSTLHCPLFSVKRFAVDEFRSRKCFGENMEKKVKLSAFLVLLLVAGGVLGVARGQSGRRQTTAQPAATPEIVAPIGIDAPTRGAGTPVWVVFADAKNAPPSEIKSLSAQVLAERAAEWLFQYGGMKVGRVPDALTANDAQELARKQTAGFILWVDLGEAREQPKNARCNDPCNPKCLREIAGYQAHYYLFAAKTGAPQLDSAVQAVFDPYLYNPRQCPPRNRGGRLRLPNSAAVCLNASPSELTPDALECLGRKVGDFVRREVAGEGNK